MHTDDTGFAHLANGDAGSLDRQHRPRPGYDPPALLQLEPHLARRKRRRVGQAEPQRLFRALRLASHRHHRPERAGRVDARVVRAGDRRRRGRVDRAVGTGDECGPAAEHLLARGIAVVQARQVQRDPFARRQAGDAHDDALALQHVGRLHLQRGRGDDGLRGHRHARRREHAHRPSAAHGNARRLSHLNSRSLANPIRPMTMIPKMIWSVASSAWLSVIMCPMPLEAPISSATIT